MLIKNKIKNEHLLLYALIVYALIVYVISFVEYWGVRGLKFKSKIMSQSMKQEDIDKLFSGELTEKQIEIKKLLKDQTYLDQILLDGVEKANLIASKKIERIKELVAQFNEIKKKYESSERERMVQDKREDAVI